MIELGRLIEVVGEGILGDLFCIRTAWAHGEFGMGRVHRSLAFMMAKYNTFLSWALIDSTALVV